jgi:hypothetical protein
MKFVVKSVLPLCLVLATVGAQAQFYRLKGATVSVSGTNLWTTPLTNDATSSSAVIGTPPNALNETVSGRQQYATSKAGVLGSLGFHPVAWAGLELNYQFAQFDEVYSFAYSSQPTVSQTQRVPVAFHEFTAAYQFHPPHIKFQPYVNIGGGYIDFLPYLANNQWRGTGLIEAGFDIPTKSPHLAVRIQGRALIYRAPNFDNTSLSTRSWRVTEEPTAGLVYRF